MNDFEDDPPPLCIPLWTEQAQTQLHAMEQELFQLLPAHGRPGALRSRIELAIRDLRYQIQQLARLGE